MKVAQKSRKAEKTNDSISSNDKKAKKSKHLGDFGFTYVTKVNGKRHEAEIGEGAINQSLRCDGCFKNGFLNR